MCEEVLPNLYRIKIPLPESPLKYLNSYVIRDPERCLIIDTGLNRTECLEAMLAGLRKIDVDLAQSDLFITHLHADHFGLVAKLASESTNVLNAASFAIWISQTVSMSATGSQAKCGQNTTLCV